MKIKKLDMTDIPLLEAALTDSDPIQKITNLRDFLADQHNLGFIAQDGEKIVGFAYGYGLLRPYGKTMLYLHTIDIAPDYLDSALTAQLLQFILDYAKAQHYSECFTIADKSKPESTEVYESCGGKSDHENEIVYAFDFNQ